jgi:hypothetical protein
MRPRDSSKLVNTPKQIRNRLRRKGAKFDEDLALYVEAGFKPLAEWDLEELARGRPRNKNGKFNGTAPKWIAPEIAKEAKRRLLDHTFGKLAGHIDQAMVVIGNVLEDESVDMNGKPIVDAKTKLAAAQFIIEHVVGKPKAVVEVGGDLVKQSMVRTFVLPDGQPKHFGTVIEGEYEEQETDGENEDDDSE